MKTIVGLLALGLLLPVSHAARADVKCEPDTYVFDAYFCKDDRGDPNGPHPGPTGAIAWEANYEGAWVFQGGSGPIWDETVLGPCPPGQCIPHDPAFAIYHCGFAKEGPDADGQQRTRLETVTVAFPELGISDTTTVFCKSMTQSGAQAWVNEEAILYMTMIIAQEMAGLGENGCLAFQVSAMCGFNPYDWNSVNDWYFGQYMLSLNWEG